MNYLNNLIFQLLKKHKDLSLFFLVGAYNTAVGYLLGNFLFYFFTDYINYKFLLVIYYLITTCHNYFAYKIFVFKAKGNFLSEFFRINILYIGILLLNLLFMIFFVEILEFSEIISYNISFVILVFISFFCQKYFVFMKKTPKI